MILEVGFKAVGRHFVWQDHVAQSIIQLAQLQLRQRRQLLVEQRLDRVRRLLNGRLQGSRCSESIPHSISPCKEMSAHEKGEGAFTNAAAMIKRPSRRREAMVRYACPCNGDISPPNLAKVSSRLLREPELSAVPGTPLLHACQ